MPLLLRLLSDILGLPFKLHKFFDASRSHVLAMPLLRKVLMLKAFNAAKQVVLIFTLRIYTFNLLLVCIVGTNKPGIIL